MHYVAWADLCECDEPFYCNVNGTLATGADLTVQTRCGSRRLYYERFPQSALVDQTRKIKGSSSLILTLVEMGSNFKCHVGVSLASTKSLKRNYNLWKQIVIVDICLIHLFPLVLWGLLGECCSVLKSCQSRWLSIIKVSRSSGDQDWSWVLLEPLKNYQEGTIEGGRKLSLYTYVVSTVPEYYDKSIKE